MGYVSYVLIKDHNPGGQLDTETSTPFSNETFQWKTHPEDQTRCPHIFFWTLFSFLLLILSYVLIWDLSQGIVR